ncbi:hypothetical protein V5O48_014450 [Marasmius crinis-equi]|uniref:Uncharacterized protein n=1 Tax=Marasmius crinis-equi TaxID=585013 RepID=A0ABR3EX91_9AGAR
MSSTDSNDNSVRGSSVDADEPVHFDANDSQRNVSGYLSDVTSRSPRSGSSRSSRGTSRKASTSSHWDEFRRNAWRKSSWGYPWRYSKGRPPIPHYARNDFRKFGWTWKGKPGRDASLDRLPNAEWARAQLYRVSPQAQDLTGTEPTFTGPQVLSRLADVQSTRIEAERQVKQMREELEKTVELVNDLSLVEEDLQDLRTLAYTWITSP